MDDTIYLVNQSGDGGIKLKMTPGKQREEIIALLEQECGYRLATAAELGKALRKARSLDRLAAEKQMGEEPDDAT